MRPWRAAARSASSGNVVTQRANTRLHLVPAQSGRSTRSTNVRFWHKADITRLSSNICFWVTTSRTLKCKLCQFHRGYWHRLLPQNPAGYQMGSMLMRVRTRRLPAPNNAPAAPPRDLAWPLRARLGAQPQDPDLTATAPRADDANSGGRLGQFDGLLLDSRIRKPERLDE